MKWSSGVSKRWVRLGAAVLSALLAGGCYAYKPLAEPSPAKGTEASFVLTDQGRAEAVTALGPGADRVEGHIVGVTDSAYALSVSRVRNIRGAVTPWVGETVFVQRAWVGGAYERRFSRSRTYLLAGAFTSAVTAFIATRTLGSGGPTLQVPNGGGGGQPQ